MTTHSSKSRPCPICGDTTSKCVFPHPLFVCCSAGNRIPPQGYRWLSKAALKQMREQAEGFGK